MTQQEIQKWIYDLKEVTPLEACALLAIYRQMGLNTAADRLDVVDGSYPDIQYAGVWLWALERDRSLKDRVQQLREELLAVYCGEGKEQVHLDGKSAFFDLGFFAQYETEYGTLQYYEEIYRQLCQVREEQRDAWYLLALIRIRSAMKESVYEYQAQIGILFKETFHKLSAVWASLDSLERLLCLTAGYEAAAAKVLLPYKYSSLLNDWYRQMTHQQLEGAQEKAGCVLAKMARMHLNQIEGRIKQ